MSDGFREKLLAHAIKSVERSLKASNEEATKQFLIVPFLQLLGYDTSDPDEILPEADASFSDKHKNRVDYAIYKDDSPVIALEAKKVGSLVSANRGELKGYYNAVASVKLGILTDGLVYQLYSDTDQENMMDDEPFAALDLKEIAEGQMPEDALDAFMKLRRSTFDPADIGADARRKIHMSSYIAALEYIFYEPTENFIKSLMDAANVEGRRTNKLIEEHREIVKEAINLFFDKKLLERVGFAQREDLIKVGADSKNHIAPEIATEPVQTDTSDIVTTESELAVYDYARHRLLFLIGQDEDLFRRISDISYRDFKGVFTVSYKQERRGRLFNFREASDGTYRFEFPFSDRHIETRNLSDIDDELLAAFKGRVEQIG